MKSAISDQLSCNHHTQTIYKYFLQFDKCDVFFASSCDHNVPSRLKSTDLKNTGQKKTWPHLRLAVISSLDSLIICLLCHTLMKAYNTLLDKLLSNTSCRQFVHNSWPFIKSHFQSTFFHDPNVLISQNLSREIWQACHLQVVTCQKLLQSFPWQHVAMATAKSGGLSNLLIP